MKSKIMILAAAALAIGSIALSGCDSNPSGSSSSAETTSSDTVSTDASSIAESVSSTTSVNESFGDVVNGVFTATNGVYQITVPDGVNLLTATDTTTVFTADEGKTTITISSEVNNGPYEDLKQENFEKVYSQLYQDFAATNFEANKVSDKQTNYRLSFTGKDKDTPLQVFVYKAMTDQRAITIQVSAAPDNDHASAILDTMAASLKIN